MLKKSELMFSNKAIYSLLLPLVGEQFLAMLIGMADTYMVSSCGEAVVSGVSLVDSIAQLMIQLFAAFATGGAVISSQYLGQRNRGAACTAAKQLMYISLAAGLAMLLLLPAKRAVLCAMFPTAETEVVLNADIYFFYVLLSFPFLALYSSSAALFRSMGNSKLSLKVSVAMNSINVAGNAALIYGLRLGAAGAGLSTMLSRIVGALIMLVLLCGEENQIYIHRPLHFEWNSGMVKRILKIGVPSGIENSIFHVGKILVQTFMARLGMIAMAANAIANSVAYIANIPGNAIGLAAVTVVGQCIGADLKEQARHYGKKLLLLGYVCMLSLAALIFAFAPQIIRMFRLGEETSALAAGVVRTCMAALVLWPPSFIGPNILRAAGDAKFTMYISTISMWLFRVLLSYVLALRTGLGLYGVWLGMYCDWLFRCAVYLLRLHGSRWLEKKAV